MADSHVPSTVDLIEQLAVHAGEEFTLRSVPIGPEVVRVELVDYSREVLALELAGYEKAGPSAGEAYVTWTFRAIRPGETTIRFVRHTDPEVAVAGRSVHVQVFG